MNLTTRLAITQAGLYYPARMLPETSIRIPRDAGLVRIVP